MNRPNVIVFFTDQQRYDTSALHGCPLDLTPNFSIAPPAPGQGRGGKADRY